MVCRSEKLRVVIWFRFVFVAAESVPAAKVRLLPIETGLQVLSALR